MNQYKCPFCNSYNLNYINYDDVNLPYKYFDCTTCNTYVVYCRSSIDIYIIPIIIDGNRFNIRIDGEETSLKDQNYTSLILVKKISITPENIEQTTRKLLKLIAFY